MTRPPTLSLNSAGNSRFNVLGVAVSAVDLNTALDTIDRWVAAREQNYVCVTGVHGVMESHRDPTLRTIHNCAGMVTPDGMPLVWVGKLLGHTGISRVYGPDLMLAVLQRSVAAGYRHYFYGGAPGVAEKLTEVLSARFPGVRVAGSYSPPFRALTADEDNEIVSHINGAAADIVWVGISTPKQERWMAEHRGVLNSPVMIGCGAAFDFNAGIKRQAPRWMQSSGLEWLFRMCAEPRRLARRYLVNNPVFLALIAAQMLGLRTPEIEP